VPATVLFARAFAAVFEIPFQRHRGWPPALRAAGRAVSRRRGGESGRPSRTYTQGAAS
jgi:hypothetical protein